MRALHENSIIKKILIVFITIIIISNFIIPNYVQASVGNDLVSGLFHLFAYLGDAGIKIMQYMMVGTDDIGTEAEPEIKYSPGLIFSGSVAMLDINFINPSSESITLDNMSLDIVNWDEAFKNRQNLEIDDLVDELEDNFSTSNYKTLEVEYLNKKGYLDDYNSAVNKECSAYTKKIVTYNYYCVDLKWDVDGIVYILTLSVPYSSLYKDIPVISGTHPNCYLMYGAGDYNGIKTVETPANALQDNIAKWYKALRTIALVGLLSVLVYIGIRIVLSSASAENKAKYKNMLKDWIVAICIIFMLHYAMAFMLQITKTLNEIIKDNVVETTTETLPTDTLMNTIRKGVGTSYKKASSDATAGYVIMYLALVILTGVFTVQYLKRVIYMAFLTMIAPMIALTYPLDKIKDGKAQAFSFWLREYIFNCLIQPVHLLLYTVLISNAIDLATGNMLYAVVALGFLVPAEKFIKAMFGMKSQSPVGTLGAVAGGALVMNMLGKIKGKPPKEGEKGDGSGATKTSKGVRTATSNSPESGTEQSSAVPTGAEAFSAPSSSTRQARGSGLRRENSRSVSNVSSARSRTATTPSIGRGLRNVGRNIGIKGVDAIKSTGGRLIRSAPGAVLGGTIGLAATVASGGEKAVSFIGGGVVAGSALSNKALGGAHKFAKDTFTEYQKGKYGIEGYNNKKFDSKFFKSEEYKSIAEDSSIISKYGADRIKKVTQNFLDNGITDAKKIKTALQEGISGDEYKIYAEAGITNVKEMVKAKQWTIEGNNGERKSVSASYYANLKKIANVTKGKNKKEFMQIVQNIRLDGEMIKKDDAEEIYKNMLDLL